MPTKPALIVILGPTGVGKTRLCLDVAERLGCEIINCDSRQVFREIPIGTAAPTAEEQGRVRHHFVGTRSVTDYYSASMYESDVRRLVAATGRSLYVLTGGSMMYLDAVCDGIDELPTVRDDIRERLKERLRTEGLEPLLRDLRALDPAHWAAVDRRNPRRVLHALEICQQTGQPYSALLNRPREPRPYSIIKVGLTRPRDEMYSRINQRVLDMVANGLVEEARAVYPLRHLNALNTVGYKELFDCFDGLIPLDEAIRQIQSDTRRYMRKQETWFKRDKSITWFSPNDREAISLYISERLADAVSGAHTTYPETPTHTPS